MAANRRIPIWLHHSTLRALVKTVHCLGTATGGIDRTQAFATDGMPQDIPTCGKDAMNNANKIRVTVYVACSSQTSCNKCKGTSALTVAPVVTIRHGQAQSAVTTTSKLCDLLFDMSLDLIHIVAVLQHHLQFSAATGTLITLHDLPILISCSTVYVHQ